MPNETYFAHADEILNLAKARGMQVTLVASYLGYKTLPGKGWWDEMQMNTVEQCRAYGRFLGLRYRSFTNIIWIAGGDNSPEPGSALEARMKAVIDGIRENDTGHYWTAHWDSTATGVMATNLPAFAPYINIEGYYAFNYDLTYLRDLTAYNKTPAKIYYHLDQSYETEEGGTPANIRRKAYCAMLMGAAGSSFNAGPNWWKLFNWKTNLDTPGAVETTRWFNLFRSRAWYELVPIRATPRSPRASAATAAPTTPAPPGPRAAAPSSRICRRAARSRSASRRSRGLRRAPGGTTRPPAPHLPSAPSPPARRWRSHRPPPEAGSWSSTTRR